MLSNDIRRAFLEFFVSKGHAACPSAPLVPNDPTLMFVNAGMVPFKDVFTGKEKRAYSRATSSQKCIRISGKHNDLENVGVTARHHTLFEMLGNFSFGDYFKEGAIEHAWELLTRVYDLPRDRLVITVFGGEDGMPADDEARAIWRKVTGFSDNRIIGLGKKDNFWQMGDTGPCGPCSEIHIWQGPVPAGGVPYDRFGQDPDASGHGWTEIWNLVFMQYERSQANGEFTLAALPAPSIDTGMGLERISSVLQGVTSNYDTDLLRALVERAAELSGKRYGGTQSPDDVSMRVIADHARLTAFLVSEGVSPDNNGRPYVLRRVMRRAIRHGHRLGINKPFLHEVALEVTRLMGDAYPELLARRTMLAATVEQEEVRFRETLRRGIKTLEEDLQVLGKSGERVLPGAKAFYLYDTLGFPLDLTEVIVAEQGFTVDEAGFKKAQEAAAQASSGSALNADAAVHKAYYDALERVPGKAVTFTGYEAEEGEGVITAIIVDGKLVDEVSWEGGEGPLPEVDVVVDATPFYGRGGGQVGDAGEITVVGGEKAQGRVSVRDTTKPAPGLVVHHGPLSQGSLRTGDRVLLEVDHEKRSATRRNHSATHLLHWALGVVLGEHVEQKGSLVGPDVLRFDFSHGKPLTQGEIERVEELVNRKILENAPILTEVLPIKEARERGAKAIFEEKYGEVVRVLTMTRDSVELCGGTHARALGDIGLFKIASEGGVAAGVRRVEATTGLNTLERLREQDRTLREIGAATRSPGRSPVEAVSALADRVRALEKERAELIRKLASGGGAGGSLESQIAQARDIGGVKVLGVQTEVSDPAALRELAEKLRDKLGDSVVLVASASGGKVMLVVTVAKTLNAKLRAGDLVRPIAQLVGGNGGGRPDMAQAGGPEVGKVSEAVAAIYAQVAAAVGAPAALPPRVSG